MDLFEAIKKHLSIITPLLTFGVGLITVIFKLHLKRLEEKILDEKKMREKFEKRITELIDKIQCRYENDISKLFNKIDSLTINLTSLTEKIESFIDHQKVICNMNHKK